MERLYAKQPTPDQKPYWVRVISNIKKSFFFFAASKRFIFLFFLTCTVQGIYSIIWEEWDLLCWTSRRILLLSRLLFQWMKVVVKIIILNKDPPTTVVLIIIVFLLLELTWPAHKTHAESKTYDSCVANPNWHAKSLSRIIAKHLQVTCQCRSIASRSQKNIKQKLGLWFKYRCQCIVVNKHISSNLSPWRQCCNMDCLLNCMSTQPHCQL